MKTDQQPFETLEKQRQSIADALRLSSDLKVDLALDSTHALNEILRGLAGLFPHKRSIARFGPLPSPVSEVVKGFAREGFTVQEIPVSLKNFDQDAAEKKMAELKRDTLFVAASFAAPLTGFLYPIEWLRTACASKGMFLVCYGHSSFLEKGLVLPRTPFEVFIYDPQLVRTTLAFWMAGERYQGEPVLWGKPHFLWAHVDSLRNYLQELQTGKRNPKNEKLIDSFERSFSKKVPGVDCFAKHISWARLYDRAAFIVAGCDGSALTEMLSKKGYDVETAASCRWDNPQINHWLLESGLTSEEIQSSLFASPDSVSRSDFAKDFESAIESLRKISGYQENRNVAGK